MLPKHLKLAADTKKTEIIKKCQIKINKQNKPSANTEDCHNKKCKIEINITAIIKIV